MPISIGFSSIPRRPSVCDAPGGHSVYGPRLETAVAGRAGPQPRQPHTRQGSHRCLGAVTCTFLFLCLFLIHVCVSMCMFVFDRVLSPMDSANNKSLSRIPASPYYRLQPNYRNETHTPPLVNPPDNTHTPPTHFPSRSVGRRSLAAPPSPRKGRRRDPGARRGWA